LSKATQRAKIELQVSISFESNRLSEQFLTTAYELAFPVIQQDTARKRIRETYAGELQDFETRKAGNLK
jgi:hypothetical protein